MADEYTKMKWTDAPANQVSQEYADRKKAVSTQILDTSTINDSNMAQVQPGESG